MRLYEDWRDLRAVNAGNEGAWAVINPIGGEASRPFFSAVREGGLVYIFSLFGEVVRPGTSGLLSSHASVMSSQPPCKYLQRNGS